MRRKDRATCRILAAGHTARTDLLAREEELGLAHHALHAWAQEHEHAQAGDVREIYLNDPATVPPEELVTEVLLPVT
ncbi:MAG TPA: GyrI-like domain-containing protein [Polyangiaceae bacterium]